MALSITALCLVFGGLTLASRSNNNEKENQYCGGEMFYCPTKYQCFDRRERCTASKICLDYNGNEAKCFESSTPGMYKFLKKTSPLPSSGSSSRKRRSMSSIFRTISHIFSYELKHWFVEYRGFAYEFGTYGIQELDVNDPNYKYGPGREKVHSEEYMGSSSCTREQVLSFVDKWLRANPGYTLHDNNCQDFAQALLNQLSWNCPSRVKREDDNTESLKATSKCATSSSCRWKLHSLFAPLISLAILYNID